MTLNKLDKRIKTVWLMIGAIISLISTAGFIGILFLETEARLPIAITGGISLAIVYFFSLVFPLIAYNYRTYGYDDKRIVINHGVIFRHNIVVPVCQIQDLHITKGPLMMLCGLSSIIISTAGSTHVISGIDSGVANDMLNELEALLNTRIEALRDE